MQNLNQSILLGLRVGVPPYAEQVRIVGKVDEIMTLCNRLEVAFAERDRLRRNLLEAVLHQAFEQSQLTPVS